MAEIIIRDANGNKLYKRCEEFMVQYYPKPEASMGRRADRRVELHIGYSHWIYRKDEKIIDEREYETLLTQVIGKNLIVFPDEYYIGFDF